MNEVQFLEFAHGNLRQFQLTSSTTGYQALDALKAYKGHIDLAEYLGYASASEKLRRDSLPFAGMAKASLDDLVGVVGFFLPDLTAKLPAREIPNGEFPITALPLVSDNPVSYANMMSRLNLSPRPFGSLIIAGVFKDVPGAKGYVTAESFNAHLEFMKGKGYLHHLVERLANENEVPVATLNGRRTLHTASLISGGLIQNIGIKASNSNFYVYQIASEQELTAKLLTSRRGRTRSVDGAVAAAAGGPQTNGQPSGLADGRPEGLETLVEEGAPVPPGHMEPAAQSANPVESAIKLASGLYLRQNNGGRDTN